MKVEEPFPATGAGTNWAELYEHLRQRIDIHVGSAVKRNIRYKRLGSLFNLVTPTVALALTIFATSSFDHHNAATVASAILLTVLTGMNSILEPTRRYAEYVQSSIELHDIRFELEARARMSTDLPESEAVVWLIACNDRISQVGQRMSGLPIARSML